MRSGLPLTLALAGSGVVAAAMWSHRPRRTRPLNEGAPRSSSRAGPLGSLGRLLRRVAGRNPDDAVDGVVGAVAVLVVIALVLAPAWAPLVVVAGAALVGLRRRRADRARAVAGADAVPDAVDLFALALASGLTVPLALTVVARRVPPPLGPALARAEVRFAHGEALDVALGRVADDAPASRPLVSILRAAHCDGAPVVEPLARLADELRTSSRRAAEARARQVPVRMLFPLVGCTLPAFVLLTVVPPVVTAFADLRR